MIEYRSLRESEYKIMTDMIKQLSDESNFYPFTSDDYSVSDDEQINFIKKMNFQDNSFLLGAFNKDSLTGMVYLYGGNRKRNYHSATLGIGVLNEYKGKKIGTNLMIKAIEYAYNCDVIGKINIQVIKENIEAVNFYKKFGFAVEGMEKRCLFIDGSFYDALNMGRIIQ